ncbi:hypothetical protein AALI21_02910 [Corynebacteriaceae bacterium 6-324]
MAFHYTVRVRKDWIEGAIQNAGGVAALAEKIGCEPSTVSRQYHGGSEAGPRFIGGVLAHCAVDFSQAFDITEEETRVRLSRIKSAA